MEENIKGGERRYKTKQDREIQIAQEEIEVERIEKIKTKSFNVAIDTVVTKDSFKKKRMPKRKKKTQPTLRGNCVK